MTETTSVNGPGDDAGSFARWVQPHWSAMAGLARYSADRSDGEDVGLIVLKKPDFELAIEAYGPAGGDRPSRAALLNFVSSITVASDPSDEDTWFPVTDVVPAG